MFLIRIIWFADIRLIIKQYEIDKGHCWPNSTITFPYISLWLFGKKELYLVQDAAKKSRVCFVLSCLEQNWKSFEWMVLNIYIVKIIRVKEIIPVEKSTTRTNKKSKVCRGHLLNVFESNWRQRQLNVFGDPLNLTTQKGFTEEDYLEI